MAHKPLQIVDPAAGGPVNDYGFAVHLYVPNGIRFDHYTVQPGRQAPLQSVRPWVNVVRADNGAFLGCYGDGVGWPTVRENIQASQVASMFLYNGSPQTVCPGEVRLPQSLAPASNATCNQWALWPVEIFEFNKGIIEIRNLKNNRTSFHRILPMPLRFDVRARYDGDMIWFEV